ncbi:unnamed protein product [Prorocentrum cordatum]|uniref:S1 motif domain-containing protein n=1 Tax=Prorocentrum cordatum TaxID=2364126 RepID=A0ABN9QAU6_9DINO|nr:unnamed protein product [Polarella glacialis]
MGMLPVREFDPAAWAALQVGERMVAYVHHKLKHTGKINMSTRPSPKPRERWDAIVCDGQTPYAGIVTSTSWHGVFVDVGCECHAILPIPNASPEARSRLEALKVGDAVTVYVVQKRKENWKVTLSLDPCEEPLRSCEVLCADGQTAYPGTVTAQTDLGAWVDIGCERPGLVSRQYRALPGTCAERLDELQVGERVETYVYLRNPANGRLILALEPSPTPRLQLGQVLGDRQGQYTGCVYRVKYDWAFLDFGCEASGMLARPGSGAWPAVGQELPVCPVGLDEETGCVVMERARPSPPPRAAPSEAA